MTHEHGMNGMNSVLFIIIICTTLILQCVTIFELGAAEGAILGLYSFDSLKSEKNRKPLVNIEPIGLSEETKSTEKDELTWNTGIIYATAQNNARKLAETPANHMTPTHFVDEIKSLLKDIPNVEVIVHDKDWATEKGMNSFLSVARGSNEPLKFLEIRYKGGEEGKKPLALVGKGSYPSIIPESNYFISHSKFNFNVNSLQE